MRRTNRNVTGHSRYQLCWCAFGVQLIKFKYKALFVARSKRFHPERTTGRPSVRRVDCGETPVDNDSVAMRLFLDVL